jgi:superfamily II RNA helicase
MPRARESGKEIDDTIRNMQRVEERFGIESPMRTCDWGLTRPLFDWIRGGTLEEIEEGMETGGGDFVRVLRMTVQLLRNARRAVPKDWNMYDALGDAVELLNRDEVDATRQLELG